MEPRRRNPLRRYPTAVCISVLHFGLTQSKTRALNSPGSLPQALNNIVARLKGNDSTTRTNNTAHGYALVI
jgi:hypothetical protein